MSFPNFPNPAQRAEMFQAHHLRQQGLSLRQIGERMGRAHSTVSVYLKHFELFRTDLIRELAADQIVSHLTHLADIDDPHHDRRLGALRELRLLLASLHGIHRDETIRTEEILQPGLAVDRYGVRYPKPNHTYPPTPEELAQEQPAEQTDQPSADLNPDQPLAYRPKSSPTPHPETVEPARTQPNTIEHENSPPPPPSGDPHLPQHTETTEPARTQPNASEREESPSPPQSGDPLLPQHTETAEPARTEPNTQLRRPRLPRNTGRNKPCPCNSGKKRKHCHPQTHSQSRGLPARAR